MRGARLVAVQVATALVAAVALGQTAPLAAPTATPTPAPSEAAPPAVRIVAAAPESGQSLSESMPVDPGLMVQTGQGEEGEKKTGKSELVIAPIPMLDPAFGYGLGLSAVYTFPKKKTEHPPPPTTLGGGGFYTSNGTWGVAAGAQLYLKEDRYRFAFAGSFGRFNYDLYPAGSELRELCDLAGLRAGSRPVHGRPRQALVRRRARCLRGQRGELPGGGEEPPPIVQDLLESKLVEIGLRVERDSRDSTFYPTTGSHLDLVVIHDDPSYGSDFTFTRSWLTYAKFFKLSEPVVLAVDWGGAT